MKKLVLGMLAMTALVGCSSNNDPVDEVGNGEKVEIKLNASSVDVQTKAGEGALTAWNDTKVQFAYGTDGTNYTGDWYGKIAAGGAVSFVKSDGTTNDPHYYDSNNLTKTYLIGYYPQATLTSNNVSFTIPETGDDDIMVTTPVNGSKNSPISNIEFKHLLTKLNFTTVKGTGVVGDIKITSIKLSGTKKTASLSIGANPTLTFSGEAGDIKVYEDATGINIGGSDPLSVMVQPGVSMTVTIIAGSVTYSNIDIKLGDAGNESSEAGKAYDVILTFSNKEVAANASFATNWETNKGTGSGDVQ